MVDLISYPFRLGVNGNVVTLPDGEDYYADELAMLVSTVPGERELVPIYGIQDPTFYKFNTVELIEKVSIFGPPIDVTLAKSETLPSGRVIINIKYEESELEDFENNNNNEQFSENEFDANNPEYNFHSATNF